MYINSWGDAVVIVSEDSLALATTALDLGDLLNNQNWSSLELPALSSRISLHCGPIYFGKDPFSEVEGIVGTQVNLAARIEPVTLPGHVWATDNFISTLSLETQTNLAWDDLGERPLAKEWGAKRLYRLRRSHESVELPSLAESTKGRCSPCPS